MSLKSLNIRALGRGGLRLFLPEARVRGRWRLLDIIYPLIRPTDGWQRAKIRGILPFTFNLDNYVERYMYFGLYETPELRFIRDSLRPGDTFIDVGANIGFISANAAVWVGTTGKIYAFEPVPKYSERLNQLAKDAQTLGYTIIANTAACGDWEGTTAVKTSKGPNIGWSTIVPGFMREPDVEETLEVSMVRLDKYMIKHSLEDTSFIKIDVEGAEWLVLQGLTELFAKGNRPIILCEVSVRAAPLVGTSVVELFGFMSSFGYSSYRLYGRKLSPVKPAELTGTSKIIWLC